MCSRTTQAAARCTLCPAGCEVGLAPAGPDGWRIELPEVNAGGLCPRGGALAELLTHRLRIRSPRVRDEAGRAAEISLAEAAEGILKAAEGRRITFLVDGNISCEELAAVAAWCGAWKQARLCLVVEPAESELLLGMEASGAKYLTGEALSECDGFVIVGDAFAANPTCARAVFDRRAANAGTPVVGIDPAGGSAFKFATHRVKAPAGTEYAALAAVARSAGVAGVEAAGDAPGAAAGAAIAECRNLGVIVAAEYGRGGAWRQIGQLAGRLAAAKGGGVAPQTSGANALAAVRTAAAVGAVSLAEAMTGPEARVAVGCDVVGMLGLGKADILAAAAGLPDRTTEAARFILPLALPGELGGTFLLAGGQPVEVAPLLAAPKGVGGAAGVVAALARAAGLAGPKAPAEAALPPRCQRVAVGPPPSGKPAGQPALVLGRQAGHAGAGALTAHASWQAAMQPLPELRISPRDAQGHNIDNLDIVSVSADGAAGTPAIKARVRYWPELPAGTLVLPEACPAARALIPSRIDPAGKTVTAAPVTAAVRGAD